MSTTGNNLLVGLKDLAYFAGLFDGEGCVEIASGERKNTRAYWLTCTVGMNDNLVVEELRRKFGGSVHRAVLPNPLHRDVYYWKLSHKNSVAFLKQIYPYARTKKPEIWLALEFDQQRTLGNSKHPPDESEQALREGFKLALMNAKKQVRSWR